MRDPGTAISALPAVSSIPAVSALSALPVSLLRAFVPTAVRACPRAHAGPAPAPGGLEFERPPEFLE